MTKQQKTTKLCRVKKVRNQQELMNADQCRELDQAHTHAARVP